MEGGTDDNIPQQQQQQHQHHETLRSLAYHDVNWSSTNGRRGNALCIGKEGTGLSSTVRNDVAKGVIRSVHVPMDGGIESLNAAVCGSVILFEYRRQCHVASQ
mmetsp:Transcript_1017/g.1112  ORF Transcript_1017/g.1112 Transcript_1017/m.1112 type:complete len:103 (+) Transcript_1017:1-309(+)